MANKCIHVTLTQTWQMHVWKRKCTHTNTNAEFYVPDKSPPPEQVWVIWHLPHMSMYWPALAVPQELRGKIHTGELIVSHTWCNHWPTDNDDSIKKIRIPQSSVVFCCICLADANNVSLQYDFSVMLRLPLLLEPLTIKLLWAHIHC